HSSGKMGYAIAEAAASAGAEVTLISGPVNLEPPQGVSRIDINSTEEMLQAALEHIEQCDIFIGCAAVADFRPAQVSEQKMKKGSSDDMQLHLTKNPDIIATVAAHPKRPFTVGFAAETQDVVNYAKDKLARKNLDLIAANDVSRADIGFNSDSNALTLISHTGVTELAKSGKAQQARTLIEHISALFDSQQATDE
ncbi:MAG: phosphopantothenoylcysteine decarboxylase, partial [Pseudomonadales bacterium]